MSTEQEPNLMLTLDNTTAFPTAQVYYEAPADGSNIHNKKLVTFFTDHHLDVGGSLLHRIRAY